MVKYNCNRCGYTTAHKQNFTKHLNKKKICPPLVMDISIQSLRDLNMSTSATNYTCSICAKNLKNKYTLKRHINNQHDKNDTISNKLDSLMREVKQIQETKVSIINQTNTINQTNIININSFGNENTDYVTDAIKTFLLKTPGIMVQKLITYIHRNQGHPENNNIKLIDDNLATYDSLSNQWEIKNKDRTLTDLVNDNFHTLEGHYDKTKGNGLSEQQKERLTLFTTKFKSGEENVIKNMETDIHLILNHSDTAN